MRIESTSRTLLVAVLSIVLLPVYSFNSFALLRANESEAQNTRLRYVIRPLAEFGSQYSVAARSTRQIQIQVTDENDRRVRDLPILFLLGSEGGQRLGTLGTGASAGNSFRAKTDAQGIATVTVIIGELTGSASITATIEGTNISWTGKFNVTASAELPQQSSNGVVSGTGLITINGNQVQNGTTVLSGSTVATGSNSHATIDLGPLGRVIFRPNTSVILTFSPSQLDIKPQSGKTKMEIKRGKVDVTEATGNKVTKMAGEQGEFQGSIGIVANGGTEVVIDGSGQVGSAGRVEGPGLTGVLSLIAVAALIATGVKIGGAGNRNQSTQPVSAARP